MNRIINSMLAHEMFPWPCCGPRLGAEGISDRSPIRLTPGTQVKNLLTIFLQSLGSHTRLRLPEPESTTVNSIARSVIIGAAAILACSAAIGATPASDKLVAQAQWRDGMINTETPGTGCFQATFPSTLWEAVPCHDAGAHPHPMPRLGRSGVPETVGNGNDYALVAGGLPGIISKTVGSFPAVSGVTSVSSVPVPPPLGDGGVLGPNEYSLQVNTYIKAKTSACDGGAKACTVWQQFVYATDYETPGSASVFMQYWLLNYGESGAKCPSGYLTDQWPSCYKNSPIKPAPDVPITDLENLKLAGNAVLGGNDMVTFTSGTHAYSVSAPDSVLQTAKVWTESEFNVFGDGGGSEAVISPGAAITVNVAAQYGNSTAPDCWRGFGSSGETNNLTLGSPCTTAGGATPSVQFTESSSSDRLVSGETIAPNQFIKSRSGQFEFILQGDGNLVLYQLPNYIVLWDSGTNGQDVAQCIMQTDGNLVLYSPDFTAAWNSQTSGDPGAYLVVQDDGNAVIYRTNGTAAWATNTAGQ